jgi:hypothetical protein
MLKPFTIEEAKGVVFEMRGRLRSMTIWVLLGVSENPDSLPEHKRESTENPFECSEDTNGDNVTPTERLSFQRCE